VSSRTPTDTTFRQHEAGWKCIRGRMCSINMHLKEIGEAGSSVSLVSGYGLDDRGSIPGRGKPLCPDRLWGPPSLLYSGYRGVKRGLGVTLTTCPHLVPRSKMSSSYTFTQAPPWRVVGQLFKYSDYAT
jgi:hypothetical protein